MTAASRYCTFFLDGMLFGVEVPSVQEVIRCQPMTRVPLASQIVSGLINLRGQIVTAIDLRKRLDLPDRPPGKSPMNVVVRTGDDAVSLLVDEIGDVIEVASETFEPSPESLAASARSLVRGAHKLSGRLLLVLNTAEAAHIPAEHP